MVARLVLVLVLLLLQPSPLMLLPPGLRSLLGVRKAGSTCTHCVGRMCMPAGCGRHA